MQFNSKQLIFVDNRSKNHKIYPIDRRCAVQFQSEAFVFMLMMIKLGMTWKQMQILGCELRNTALKSKSPSF